MTLAVRTARVSSDETMNQAARRRRRTSVRAAGSPEDCVTFDSVSRFTSRRDIVHPAHRKRSRVRRRARILLIEDDPYAREALALLLDFYGYDVVSASNGTDGLELMTEATPDLVVTDWRMPGLSGRALCIALRERRDSIPIVVVTSAEEVFSQDQPVNARLRKPIDPSLLSHTIARELEARRHA